MSQAKALQTMARSRGTAAKLAKPVLRVSECDAIDSVRHLLSKGTCTTVQVQFSQPAELPLCVTALHHAARLKSMILLSHHIDMVNADQFRKGVRRIAVDRGASWRLPG